MAKKQNTDLKKISSKFQLIGEAKVGDFTYKIDEQSQHSDWIYNVFKLGVNCGECGDIYAEMMGGYGAERDNIIYVHGKKEDEKGNMVDDFKNQYTIDWEDRFDESILSEIGDLSFFTVGIEKDLKGKTFVKKFLSEYDAIAYIKEHLEDGMVVNIKGNTEYSVYDESVQKKRKINSIFLSKIDNPEKYIAKFEQTILVDKDSLKKLDKDKNVFPIEAYVPEYIGKPKIDGKKVEVKRTVSLPYNFELNITDLEKTTKLANKLFKPKKSSQLYEITVEGIITKGGTTQTATLNDLPEDIRDLVEWGALTEEEALEKCVGKGSQPETMLIKNPKINKIGEEKTPAIALDTSKYTIDDLLFYAIAIEEACGEIKEDFDDSESEEIDTDDLDLDALLEEIE